MIFRTADISDIPQIQFVRHAVRENRLSNPALVTDEDVADYITRRGKGWVCEQDNQMLGFAIADLQDHNIWALFVHPDYEAGGVGGRLHDLMLDWYFAQTAHPVWLGTAPGTRAEQFYKYKGWRTDGVVIKGELRFEMTFEDWLK